MRTETGLGVGIRREYHSVGEDIALGRGEAPLAARAIERDNRCLARDDGARFRGGRREPAHVRQRIDGAAASIDGAGGIEAAADEIRRGLAVVPFHALATALPALQ